MKNILVITCVILFFSFNEKKDKIQNPLVWSQVVGEDSVRHTYKFKKIGESLILESILIEEKNPAGSPKYIYSNQIVFDNKGKFNKLFVNRSISLKNLGDLRTYQYDEDIVRYENDSLKSMNIKNNGLTFLSLKRCNNLMVQRRSDNLDYPIYDFSKNKELIIPKIGKGVNPNLTNDLYYQELFKGLK